MKALDMFPCKILVIILSMMPVTSITGAQDKSGSSSINCDVIKKGLKEYSEAIEQIEHGNIVLGQKSFERAKGILRKELFTGRTIKSVFMRYRYVLNSTYLAPVHCNSYYEDGDVISGNPLLFTYLSKRDIDDVRYLTPDDIIEKFEILKEEETCEATIQLIPHDGENGKAPFYLDKFGSGHVFTHCKILNLKKLNGKINNDVDNDDDNPTNENSKVIDALSECMQEDSGCSFEYLFGKVYSDPFYSNRSGDRIQKIWNATKRKLLKTATANMYNENAVLIDEYISFREKPYYHKALNMLLKVSPKPDEDTLDKAGEVMMSLKNKGYELMEKYPLSFWYRRHHDKNDAIAYSILKEIKSYYENEKNYSEEEDIHHAIESGNITKVMKLIELGSDINKIHKWGNCLISNMTPLIVAAKYNRIDIAKQLINKGANVNSQEEVELPAIIMAATQKNNVMIDLLLKNGAEVNTTGNLDIIHDPCYINKATALHIAVFHNNYDMVSKLISAGANVNALTANNETAINLAREEKMFNLLEEKGSKIFNDSFPLHTAAMYGNTKILKILISKGCDVNSRNSTGETPLHCAAVLNNIDNAKVLIEHGCDVNAKTRYNRISISSGPENQSKEYIIGGGTPLHYLACYNQNDEFAKLLIKRGANKKEKDHTGRTPHDIYNIGERPTNTYPYEWESSYLANKDINDYSEVEKKQERFWELIKTD